VLRDERVHAVGKRGEDPLAVGVIAGPLRVVERSAVSQQPRGPIAGHRSGAGDLRHPSFRRAAPHLHLPQPVLRHDVALREEEVVGGLRRDVRHAQVSRTTCTGARSPSTLMSPSICASADVASPFTSTGDCAVAAAAKSTRSPQAHAPHGIDRARAITDNGCW
jgi:hypothetical protein